MGHQTPASEILEDELIAAFTSGKGNTVVQTPGYFSRGQQINRGRMTLQALLVDEFDEMHAEALIALIGAAMASKDPAVRLPAQAYAARLAKTHAAFHADDLAEVEA